MPIPKNLVEDWYRQLLSIFISTPILENQINSFTELENIGITQSGMSLTDFIVLITQFTEHTLVDAIRAYNPEITEVESRNRAAWLSVALTYIADNILRRMDGAQRLDLSDKLQELISALNGTMLGYEGDGSVPANRQPLRFLIRTIQRWHVAYANVVNDAFLRQVAASTGLDMVLLQLAGNYKLAPPAVTICPDGVRRFQGLIASINTAVMQAQTGMVAAHAQPQAVRRPVQKKVSKGEDFVALEALVACKRLCERCGRAYATQGEVDICLEQHDLDVRGHTSYEAATVIPDYDDWVSRTQPDDVPARKVAAAVEDKPTVSRHSLPSLVGQGLCTDDVIAIECSVCGKELPLVPDEAGIFHADVAVVDGRLMCEGCLPK
ncbi:hypothetical protein J8273_4510 [Carpediemonas membranifera]|uniref:Uncharacterized protein n=1 Tax=Carpediemonas membranifera TaxID=201153 RepID=A0A8J6E9W6_9EUKA|nr:hypothetical protein J8273_4510 [Carpediemonas membranifera]|eukprot:KAG9393910.1 hypothetical protein J8273_4510 [Carpediemonas membranifera]